MTSPHPIFWVTNIYYLSKGQLFYSRGHNEQFQVTYNSIKGMEDNQDVKTIQATLQSHPSLWLLDGLELLATSSNQSALSWCLLPLCCSWPISSQQILKGLPAHNCCKYSFRFIIHLLRNVLHSIVYVPKTLGPKLQSEVPFPLTWFWLEIENLQGSSQKENHRT